MSEKIKLSQLKGQEVRVTIPTYIQDEFVGDIIIKNPTIALVEEIKQHARENNLDDGLREKLLRELTNIDVDCAIDDEFVNYYNDIFVSVMIEIDAIIMEITTNAALEMYTVNKMSDNKQAMLVDTISKQSEIIESINQSEAERKRNKELQDAEDEMKLIKEKIDFLKGESNGEQQ